MKIVCSINPNWHYHQLALPPKTSNASTDYVFCCWCDQDEVDVDASDNTLLPSLSHLGISTYSIDTLKAQHHQQTASTVQQSANEVVSFNLPPKRRQYKFSWGELREGQNDHTTQPLCHLMRKRTATAQCTSLYDSCLFCCCCTNTAQTLNKWH